MRVLKKYSFSLQHICLRASHRQAFFDPSMIVNRKSRVNVIDLTNWFITRVESSSLNTLFPWILSTRPDGFNGHDEQIK